MSRSCYRMLGLLLVRLLAVSAPCRAAGRVMKGALELSGKVGRFAFDDQKNWEDGVLFSGAIGYWVSEAQELELAGGLPAGTRVLIWDYDDLGVVEEVRRGGP